MPAGGMALGTNAMARPLKLTCLDPAAGHLCQTLDRILDDNAVDHNGSSQTSSTCHHFRCPWRLGVLAWRVSAAAAWSPSGQAASIPDWGQAWRFSIHDPARRTAVVAWPRTVLMRQCHVLGHLAKRTASKRAPSCV